ARRPAPRRNRAARLERRGHAERAAHHAEERVSEDRVWGRNPVLELLRGGGRRVDEVAVLAGGRGPLTEVVALARRVGVKVSYRTREQLAAIAGTDRHQGVVARVAAGEYFELDALLEIPRERGEAPFLLALDQVQDPRNFVSALETVKKSGVWIYGSTISSGVSLWAADLTGPLCLVLGSEGEGLRPLVARTCDILVTIPMAGRIGSLNVAAAAAVFCYEVARQRRLKTQTP